MRVVRFSLWSQLGDGITDCWRTSVSFKRTILMIFCSFCCYSRICWPYDADQPTNAANVAFVHGAGYELFEVRNGHGLRQVHRLGDKTPDGTLEAVRQEALDVFCKARGKDGEAKRAKAQWFSEQFAKTWEEGGEGWAELGKLLEQVE